MMGAVDIAVKIILGLIPILASVFQASEKDIKERLAKHPEIQSRASDKVFREIEAMLEKLKNER